MQSLAVRPSAVRIGLALGGGFARGIAHAGLLEAFQRHRIPIHCVAGVSAGAVVAAAYASGTTADEIAYVGRSMRFSDVGRWRPGRLGLVSSTAMTGFLGRLLKTDRFEGMRVPLGVLATDLATGEPIVFSTAGSVVDPVRASCAYPGLFQPVQSRGRLLVDGAMSVCVPAALARQLGATHVISVTVPPPVPTKQPSNLFQVVSRCLQIMQRHTDDRWRAESDLVIAPDVSDVEWHRFDRAEQLIEAGERAGTAAVPEIRRWLAIERPVAA
jgi:NTE family protein